MGFVVQRRAFLASMGLATAGLCIGMHHAAHAQGASTPPNPAPDTFRPNVFVHIAPDGAVTIACHRSEMGQGIRSSLPVLVADELGADFSRVAIVQADGDKKYGDQNTDGSRSVRNHYDEMRQMGAMARTMLIAAAAKQWGVSPAGCSANNHFVSDASGQRRVAFGELVEAASKMAVPALESIVLRPRSELKRVGGPLPLLEGPEIATGAAIYGADVRLDGMLVAVIARPPVVGGQVSRYDDKAALEVAGVTQVIQMPSFKAPAGFQPLGGIAVLATNTWAAMRGRARLTVEWEHGAHAHYDSAEFKQQLLAAVRTDGRSMRRIGDASSALAKAKKTVQAEYYVPHLAHAAMEPPAALASFSNGRCEVWACTQTPQAAIAEVARALDIDPGQVTVHVTRLGGGFGRKSKPDYIAEAALLSRQVGKPVRVQWSREDDIQNGYFHTVSAQRLEAAIGADNKVTAWRHRTAFPPIRWTFNGTEPGPTDGELGQGILDLPLDVPNVEAQACDAAAHVRIGWLRSVCNIFHAFSVGSFIDELAHARGLDPKDNLLELLGPSRIVSPAELGVAKVPNYGSTLDKHPVDVGRMRHCIEWVTHLSDWTAARKSGRALGLACHRSFNTCVAVVVSASHKPDSTALYVDEAWVVADAGIVINPDRVRAQLEGSIIFGISIAQRSAITMRHGAVEQTNYRDYRVARIGESPKAIHVEIVKSDAPPGGVGEPGLPPVAPAIANAAFALVGKRYRDLPFV